MSRHCRLEPLTCIFRLVRAHTMGVGYRDELRGRRYLQNRQHELQKLKVTHCDLAANQTVIVNVSS